MDVGWKYGAQPRRLLTFALDGKATIPPSPPRDMVVHALDDPSLTLSEADIKAGQGLAIMCIACHGVGFKAAGSPAPDLRESPVALTSDGIWAVVHDGALQERGMPKFDMLTRKQVNQLHAYIRAAARESLGLRPPEGDAGPAHM